MALGLRAPAYKLIHSQRRRAAVPAQRAGGQFSPSLKSPPDLLQEGDPLFGSGMIHIVMGEIIAPNRMARHRTYQTFHNPLGRVAKQETDSASAP